MANILRDELAINGHEIEVDILVDPEHASKDGGVTGSWNFPGGGRSVFRAPSTATAATIAAARTWLAANTITQATSPYKAEQDRRARHLAAASCADDLGAALWVLREIYQIPSIKTVVDANVPLPIRQRLAAFFQRYRDAELGT